MTAAYLIRGAEDMSVILNEPPHTRQTAQRSACLVTMKNTELSDPERKLSVTALSAVKDETVTWAVHGFERKFVLLDFEAEHVFGVVLPVSGGLPQLRVVDVGRADCERKGRMSVIRWKQCVSLSPSVYPRVWYSDCVSDSSAPHLQGKTDQPTLINSSNVL